MNISSMAKPEDALIRNLMSPSAYPHPAPTVELTETHISWVLLAGDFAYKVKKPVNFGFLNFSTLELRRYYCNEEVRLNRRLAADWYLGIEVITGSIERPQIGGDGPIVDYSIKMRRFPSASTLKNQVKNGVIHSRTIDEIGDLLAKFHSAVDRASSDSPYGSSSDVHHWFDENFAHLKPGTRDPTRRSQLCAIKNWGKAQWRDKAALMDQRKRAGFIRECHGDLHLGNMTSIDGKVLLFDCIEFNPQLRWIDVISEVAFFVIDLLHFKFEGFAWRFLNRYLQHTGDYEGVALLRYYLVYRALVLAKVCLLRSEQQQDPALQTQNLAEFDVYLQLAERFTRTQKPLLIIMHGFSGAGKSSLASQIAEKIGALHLRSDIERKRLFGFGAEQDTGSSIRGGIYTADATALTYQRLANMTETILRSGFSVIVDATFLKFAQRDQFRQLAESCAVDYRIVSVQAAPETLKRRIDARRNTSDPSEATLDVLQNQLKTAEPLDAGELENTLEIDSNCYGEENQLMKIMGALFPNSRL